MVRDGDGARNKLIEQPARRCEGRLAQDRHAPKQPFAPIPRVSSGMTGPALLVTDVSLLQAQGGASRDGEGWRNRGPAETPPAKLAPVVHEGRRDFSR